MSDCGLCDIAPAFSTEMHYYNLRGVRHFAPSTALSVPAVIAPAVHSAEATAWASLGLACAMAALDLFRHRLPRLLLAALDAAFAPIAGLLLRLHSGLVGDYVAWIAAGLALLGAAFAFR